MLWPSVFGFLYQRFPLLVRISFPRKIPYLFVWKRPEDSSVREVVRVSTYSEPPRESPVNWTGCVEIKRHDGTRDFIRTLLKNFR
jgi:hypothetical protein